MFKYIQQLFQTKIHNGVLHLASLIDTLQHKVAAL